MPGDSDDNSDDWEFKVLRSNLNGFRNPEVMKKCLEEEARAGWVFVEKFDDARIRFKRPISSRRADARLNFDPYRTMVGISDKKMYLMTLGIAIGASLATFGLMALMKILNN